MMDTNRRQSHCIVCGRRLSTKDPSGNIQWQPSEVDDKGIYCETCYSKKTKSKSMKKKNI